MRYDPRCPEIDGRNWPKMAEGEYRHGLASQ